MTTQDRRQVLTSRSDGPVTTLTLNRPEFRNALNTELCRAIHAGVDDAIAAGARVVVITGQGSAFCSGADLNGVYGDEFLEALYGMLHHLAKVPVPIVAAVNGPAIGAGTQLALACDLRVADESAKFGVPTVRNGMAVDAWTVRTLGKLAGAGAARRMLIAGELITRDEALAYGMVERAGGVDSAQEWAHEIAKLAPLAIAHNKLILNGSREDDAAIEESFARVWASEDVKEAAAARVEKRAPQFRGR